VEYRLKVPKPVSIIATMLCDQTGFWVITSERVALLKANRNKVHGVHREAIDELISSSKGKRMWECRAEFMAALQQILSIYQRPTEQDLRAVLQDLRVGSSMEGMTEQAWVKGAVTFLERLIEYESLEPSPTPIDEVGTLL